MKMFFRPLTEEEIEVVSGGNEIVVTAPGGGGGGGWGGGWGGGGWGWGSGGDSGGYEGGGSGGSDGDENSEPPPEPGMDETTEIIVQGAIADLQQNIQDKINELGKDFTIIVEGQSFSAQELVDSMDALGKLFDAYEAYQLTDDLISGDASAADAIAFVGALAIAAGVGAAAGPLAGFAAGVAAGYLLPGAVSYAGDLLNSAFDSMVANAASNIGYEPADPSWPDAIQELDFLLRLFNPFYDPPEPDPYFPPYGGGGYGGGTGNYDIP